MHDDPGFSYYRTGLADGRVRHDLRHGRKLLMSAPLHGQVAITASAQALSATPLNSVAFVIKAPVSNINAVYIGAAAVSTGTGYQLDPGDTFEYELNTQQGRPLYQLRLSDFYAIGTVGSDKVTWLASPLP